MTSGSFDLGYYSSRIAESELRASGDDQLLKLRASGDVQLHNQIHDHDTNSSET
eukprot:CAMPEP_0184397532 /NCGR_PEP_ID=MMETSP0007-20130409/60813_1 /TAXON_ID=97485 /ORGANISM="Prymnesium parvum, Strain Texoma1" /LENGTH=53 /DNA_ID=CAMNT_0026751019 /DNA_START=241 /DNA_END=403 /DNA_ORIENTATION=-